MTFNDIVIRMINLYTASDGLGRIDLDDNNGSTVRNENGILFKAYQLALGDSAVKKHDLRGLTIIPFYFEVLRTHSTSISMQERPGLFNRWPGVNTSYERHDNYIGHCAISVLNDDEKTPQEMLNWAYSHWLCFNNVNPDKFKKEQLRQPGEFAVYYVAAGKEPPFIFWLWLLVGILAGIMKKDSDPPQLRLTWLRLWVIDQKGVKGWLKRTLYKAVRTKWFKLVEEKHGGMKGIWGFPEGHPVNEFVKLLT